MTDLPSARVESRLRRHLHDHWKAYTIQGVIEIIIGILAILAPFAATLATTIFFGWLFLIGGVIGVIAAVRAREAPGFWANLALSVACAILGIMFLINPLSGAVTLTWIMATFFILSGVFNFAIARAFSASTGRFWLVVISGIIDIALALFLIIGLPMTAIWAIGLFVGISFLTSGFSVLFAALDARNHPPARL
ncbi:MAG: DUF308 domain-containing protein [Hyphomicrobiales bacterium]|nr:DUF308 domain-containing protein [Hyphomicrobiales bacterium]